MTSRVKGMPYKVAALFDFHIPHAIGRAISPAADAALKYCERFHPDEIIIGGDFMDLGVVSHFTANKPLLREGKRLLYEYEAANAVLDRVLRCCKRVTYLEGNHEVRIAREIETSPYLQGLIEVNIRLDLERKRVMWIPEIAKPHRIGNASFTHGWYTNKYHAARSVAECGSDNSSLYYGHTHDVQSYVQHSRVGEPVEGHSMGCLCELNPRWLRGKPSRWTNAFGIFYINDDGSFTRYIPIIVGGKFTGPDGKLYRGV